MADEFYPQNQNDEEEYEDEELPFPIDPSYADYDDDDEDLSPGENWAINVGKEKLKDAYSKSKQPQENVEGAAEQGTKQGIEEGAEEGAKEAGRGAARGGAERAGEEAIKKGVEEGAKDAALAGTEVGAEAVGLAAAPETAGASLAIDVAIELEKHAKEIQEKAKKQRRRLFLMQLSLFLAVITFPIIIMGFVLMTMPKPDPAAAATFSGTVCLDPGHSPNSKTPGESGEIEINFKVATELKALLESEGIKVVLTKNNAFDNVDNDARPGICQAGGASFMYSIHNDSSVGGKKGPYHIYPRADRTNIYATSKQYAEILQQSIAEELGVAGKTTGEQPVNGGYCQEGQKCTRPSLGVMSAGEAINIPVFLIEMVALDAQGRAWINTDTNRAKLVRAMANGLKKIPGTTDATGAGGGGKMANVPIYYQGDGEPWASDSYGGCGSYASSGCGPTSIAMVVSYWTGKRVTPPEIGKIAVNKGWRVCGSGTATEAAVQIPRMYGLKTRPLSGSDRALVMDYLRKGIPVIARQHCCVFTSGGHFVVATGVRSDGKITIRDPNRDHKGETDVVTEAQFFNGTPAIGNHSGSVEGFMDGAAVWK